MASIEKTIFISYRRKDIAWALAVYQYLTSQKYDVFFDYTSIPSGDFEQIIVSNIRARAHFVLILTPTALDRCSQPGDWLRREIETAVDEKRNIIPLLFDGFNFASPSVIEKLTGKLASIPRYNALEIPSGYFIEAMERLSRRYLNIPLDAVIHPVSTEVQKVVQEVQVAADKALEQKKEDIEELVRPAEDKTVEPKQAVSRQTTRSPLPSGRWGNNESKTPSLRLYGIGAGILLIAALGIFAINSLIQNAVGQETPMPTFTSEFVSAIPSVPATQAQLISTSTENFAAQTSVPPIAAGSTMVSPPGDMTLLYIPAGQFKMGLTRESPTDQLAMLTPLCNLIKECEDLLTNSHSYDVALSGFWISQTEVSNGSYALCVSAGGCTEPRSRSDEYSNSNYYALPDFRNYPVVWVSWTQAREFCQWAGGDLPTSAQWEYAARGWDGRLFPWGNGFPEPSHVNVNNFYGQLKPVDDFKDYSSPFGLLNASGNVWEWTLDWYDPNFYDRTATLVDPMVDSNQYIINGAPAKVVRGSSAWYHSALASVAVQDWEYPDRPNFGIGFRCVLPVP